MSDKKVEEFNKALIDFGNAVNEEYEKIVKSGVEKELFNVPNVKILDDLMKEIEKYLKDNAPSDEYRNSIDALKDICGGLKDIYCNFYFSQGILLMLNKEGNINE